MNDADLSFFTYADSPYTVRQNLQDAHRSYWHALASPGTWFSGAERVAIAAEVRNALDCPFCAERKTALSPYSLKGEHRSDNQLDPRVVDAIHRVITDQSRITQAYIDDNASAGFTEEQYVEMVGIAVTVLSVDEFNRALGLPLETLPAPLPGGPSHYRPSQAEHGTGFVAMIPANGATGNESDLWERERTANVLRALTLVPNAMREWMAVAAQQYLSIQGMTQFTTIPGRAINRMQIELVAGRVSSHNECFYWTSSHASMLSLSADITESDVDLRVVNGDAPASEGDIEHGQLLMEFAEAFASRNEEALATARSALLEGAGAEVLVDSAAVAANFQRMVRIADSTGIPLDERNAILSYSVVKKLHLDRFESARNTPQGGLKRRLLSLIAKPLAIRKLKKLAEEKSADI